ncbi:MAG: class I SAM-dependent methyltransferase [Streptosporangiaceae bacterium]
MTTATAPNIVERLLIDKPSFHLSGAARWDALPETLEAIARFARPGDTTLEVGVGVSTVVFAASGTHHTAISCDPAEHERVREYCQQIGIDDSRLDFAVGMSDDVLPALLTRDRTLDMALVDGAHSFPLPVVDWHYVARALKVGGRLLLDDIPVPAVGQVFRHMKLEAGWRLDGIFDDRAAAFTLIALPDQDDDWIRQPFNMDFPDYSFAALPKQLCLENTYRLKRICKRAGQRYPVLRRIYKRIV